MGLFKGMKDLKDINDMSKQYKRPSMLEGLANIKPQGPDEWAPRNARGEMPDALTLRAVGRARGAP